MYPFKRGTSLWPVGQNFNNSSDWKPLSPLQSCFYRTTTFFTFSWECQEKPLSLLLYLGSQLIRHRLFYRQKKGKKKTRRENPLIAFKLFSFIASCWKKGWEGHKKRRKSIASVCLPPVMIHFTPTLLPCTQEPQFTGQRRQPERAQTPH